MMSKSADRKYKKGVLIALAVTNVAWAASFVAFVTWLALKSAQDTPVCSTKPCLEQSVLIMNSVDESTHPCDDFYQHVCGSWMQQAQASSEGMASPITNLEKDIKRLLSSSLAKWHIESNGAVDKAATLYKHCVDMDRKQEYPILSITNALNYFGNAPMLNYRWNAESFNLGEFMATSLILGQSFLVLEVSEDLRNSSIYRLALAMPESFYERHMLSLMQNYVDYYLFINSTVKAFMDDRVLPVSADAIDQSVKEILALEVQLYHHLNNNVSESVDDGGPPRSIKFSELDPFYQDIIKRLLRKLEKPDVINPNEEIILSADEETIMKIKEIIIKTPAKVLANYEAWSLLRGPLFEALPKHIRSLQERILLQISDQYGTDRRYHCLSLVQKYYEYALGRLYVNQQMNSNYKQEAVEMTRVIANAFRRISLESNDWLDEKTRAAALEKLNTLRFEIAYPEFILNSSALDAHYKHMPDAESVFGNFAAILIDSLVAKARHRYERFARRTVDKQEWEMGPYEVNAYYSLSSNKVAIPAGHLTLPLFHPLLPQSFNYGALGWTIGHEIAHAFDTKGRRFDKNGNLKNWWSNDSLELFENKTACIGNAASNFCYRNAANESRCINPKMTLDEDVADLAGMRAAFYGYEQWRTTAKLADEKLSGLMKLSNEQLFFIAAGLPWCEVFNITTMEISLLTDNHSPVKFRLNNAVRNMPEFSKAFKCPLGSAMNSGNARCKVW